MTKEQVRGHLERNGYAVSEESRLANNTGSQIRLKSGQIVNIFDKGTFSVQGKNPEPIRKLVEQIETLLLPRLAGTDAGMGLVDDDEVGTLERKIIATFVGFDEIEADNSEGIDVKKTGADRKAALKLVRGT